MMLVVRVGLVELCEPGRSCPQNVVRISGAKFGASPIPNTVFRLLEHIEQLRDRLAGNRSRLEKRLALIGDAINAPVGAVAVWIADGMLQVTDNGVVPVDEPDRAVGAGLDVGRAEVRIG